MPLPHCLPNRPTLRLIASLAILLPANSLAQSDRMPARPAPSHPWADSAAAAREHYRAAVAAFRAQDLPTARRHTLLAQRAFPAQPGYLVALASLAARAGDTAAAVVALSQLTALGASHPLEADPAFQTMRSAPPILAVVEHSRSVLGSWANSRVEATIGPADFFAEGVARGPDGSFYLTSVRHGRVVRRTPDGRETDLLAPGETLWAVSGIGLASDGQSVWVSSNAIPQRAGYDSTQDGRSELVRLNVSGGVMRRIAVPGGEAGAMIGDLLVMPDGGVYGSDTRGQAIWYLESGGSEPRVVARHPLVRSPQGLVPAGDGIRLLVADYSHGILMVDPRNGAVEPLPFPEGTTLLGIDGLARHGRDLIAIQNGGVVPRVLRLRLDAAETRLVAVEVIDRNLKVAEEPTLGVVVGDDFYYVANSQWEKRGEDGTPRDGVTLVPAVILRLSLR